MPNGPEYPFNGSPHLTFHTSPKRSSGKTRQRVPPRLRVAATSRRQWSVVGSPWSGGPLVLSASIRVIRGSTSFASVIGSRHRALFATAVVVLFPHTSASACSQFIRHLTPSSRRRSLRASIPLRGSGGWPAKTRSPWAGLTGVAGGACNSGLVAASKGFFGPFPGGEGVNQRCKNISG